MNRTLVRATTAAAAVSAAALFFPAVANAAPVSGTNCAAISTGTGANGWGNTFSDESGQAGKHVADTIVDSDGSLKLTTVASAGSPAFRAASYHAAGQLKLADLTGPLSFDHSGETANWQIRVTDAAVPNSSNGFATLVWTGNGADAANSDQWWATKDLPGLARGETTTLADLKSKAGPDTVINDYGISIQADSADKTALIDNVSFNGCTTNFKATGSTGGDGGAFGSLGGLGLGNLIPGLIP